VIKCGKVVFIVNGYLDS